MLRHSSQLLFTSIAALLALPACGGATESPAERASESRAAATLAIASVTADLVAIQDSRTQLASGDVNFGSAQLWINTQNSHFSFVEFDTSALPADAEIVSAELVLRFTGNYAGAHAVEVGRVEGDWSETTITWNNQPAITWGGPQQVVGDAAGDVRWNVTGIVTAWQTGARPNEGFALRGAVNGPGKLFHSKDTSTQYAPRLVVTYRPRPEAPAPRPDLGDAPDSTNHHGVVNTAYPGVPGQFPTVWNMAAQPAGPRHANAVMQGWLGNVISRETEADLASDADGPNNILRDAAGVISDIANRDRGDDSWRNPNIRFFHCQQQTLQVRVSKAPAATLKKMYLNVFFDGRRDGDWDDTMACQPPSGGPAQAGYEWIVQNYIVDMTSVPAGGFRDFNVNTERVLNVTQGMPHWMRFMLSEEPAVQPLAGGLPDGRGPHPTSPLGSYQFGETEDVFQLPPPPGAPGELVLEKRVVNGPGTFPQGGLINYRIKLRHEGGTAPAQASIDDLLPLPLAELHLFSMPSVSSATGGAAPLFGITRVEQGKHGVSWNGILAPDSEVTLDIRAHVHPTCFAFQASKSIANVATASSPVQQLSAQASALADCPGNVVLVPHDTHIDVNTLPPFTP
ncbi:MAG TPA: DNRLRE domain-containing protein [Polyangiaceae bacterium]|nr:DNRLRE domain-containing protein [Polyangiaceae bacterium]